MSELIIHHHLGLGDHLDCNGMVRYILKNTNYDKIHVFSKSNYYDMIEYMYRDNPNIYVAQIDKNLNEDQQVFQYVKESGIEDFLRVGFENYPFGQEHLHDKNCWEFFYDQVKIPYSARTDYFYFERDNEQEVRLSKKLNPENKPYIFVHDDKSRGYEVDRKHFLDSKLLVVENDITENIFYFTKILEEATEIHCMESSFKSLIDLYAGTNKIFYHDFRNQPLGNYTNKKWSVIKYD